MSMALPSRSIAVLVALVLALAMGCGTRSAWSRDESERIEQILKSEKFSEDLPGAAGTSVYAAAAPGPALPEKDYAIQNTHSKPPGNNHHGTATSRSRERARSSSDPAPSGSRPAR